nr:calcium-binding protein [Rhodobacter capsulatus]
MKQHLARLSGDAGNDTLSGGLDADTLSGGTGNDLVSGGAGADLAHGDAGDDRVFGDGGADALFGDAGADQLSGGGDNDRLDGGSENDLLRGGDGADVLIGGTGADTLEGGAGADTFVFLTTLDSLNSVGGSDHITRFELGVDRIDLSALAPGAEFHLALVADGAGAVVTNLVNGATVVSVFTDADAAPDLVFQIDALVGTGGLTEADFLF